MIVPQRLRDAHALYERMRARGQLCDLDRRGEAEYQRFMRKVKRERFPADR